MNFSIDNQSLIFRNNLFFWVSWFKIMTERASLPGPPSITVEADVWNATWITYKAFELVDRTKLALRTNVKAGESVDITFILEVAGIAVGTSILSGFGGQMGQVFAKDLYRYVKKRIRAVEKKRIQEPHTRQKVRILRRTVEWEDVIAAVDQEDH